MQFASGRIAREFNGQISQVQCRLVHILHPHSLIRVGYAITRAWVSGIGLLPVGERHRGGEASIRGGRQWRATRRDGGAGQTDVSEQSERWRLIDWFVGGRIISRTRTAPTHCG